jgi:hypothetical protein
MRKRAWLIILVAIAAVGLALWLVWPAPEPSYNGHPLSYWTSFYMAGPLPERFGSDPRADFALSQMGTNALPHLLRWFNYNPTPRFRSLEPLYRLLPPAISHYPTVVHLFYKNANHERADCAFLGLIALAPQAAPAIPDLARVMNTTNSSSYWPGRAALLLVWIGKPAIPELAAAVTNTANPNRRTIIQGVGLSITNASLVRPVLTNLLLDPDPAIRAAAERALTNLAETGSTNRPAQ